MSTFSNLKVFYKDECKRGAYWYETNVNHILMMKQSEQQQQTNQVTL